MDERRVKVGVNSSAPACYWIYGGEVRYVAEKKLANPPGTTYACMGWLIGDTDNEDKAKPCFWIFVTDKKLR
jgi:hypothetical protein